MAKRYTDDELKKIDRQFLDLIEEKNYSYLVVENSVALRKALVNALSSAGCENIAEAKDGMEALMQIRKLPGKTIIITELNLPIMDGIEMLRKIRSDDAIKESPVILISSESRKEKIVEAIKLGVSGYLKKPFQPPVLIEKLTEIGCI